MTTGEKIKTARESADMTRQALADATGMLLRNLEAIEQNRVKSPKLADVAKIAVALGKSVVDFIADEEPPAPKPSRGRPKKPKPQ